MLDTLFINKTNCFFLLLPRFIHETNLEVCKTKTNCVFSRNSNVYETTKTKNEDWNIQISKDSNLFCVLKTFYYELLQLRSRCVPNWLGSAIG